MFEDFLNHTCNIYHTEEEEVNPGYGVQARVVRKFGETADVEGVQCHFHIKNNSLRITQNEPYTSADGDVKLTVPYGTDIRENDVIEDCSNGLKYRAGIPKTIHGNHHITVMLYREGGIRSAI